MMTDQVGVAPSDQPLASGDQVDKPRVQLRVDDRERPTEYVNAFLTIVTAEEILLDVGVNAASAVGTGQGPPRLDLKLSSRLAMNYFTAKRLAISLSRIIREYESRFGDIELDLAKRSTRAPQS